MLLINDLSIDFDGKNLFKHLSFHLKKGETGCVIGPSGCGKSSLLNAIMGFTSVSEGTIHIQGSQLTTATIDTLRHTIAWIPQELALPLEWVSDMVQLPFSLRANSSVEFNVEQIIHLFSKLGIPHDLYYKRVNEISGGQRQRIMIAAAAMLHKPLWLLDEPTSALDGASTELVINFLRQQSISGTTILCVSHNAVFAEACNKQIKFA